MRVRQDKALTIFAWQSLAESQISRIALRDNIHVVIIIQRHSVCCPFGSLEDTIARLIEENQMFIPLSQRP